MSYQERILTQTNYLFGRYGQETKKANNWSQYQKWLPSTIDAVDPDFRFIYSFEDNSKGSTGTVRSSQSYRVYNTNRQNALPKIQKIKTTMQKAGFGEPSRDELGMFIYLYTCKVIALDEAKTRAGLVAVRKRAFEQQQEDYEKKRRQILGLDKKPTAPANETTKKQPANKTTKKQPANETAKKPTKKTAKKTTKKPTKKETGPIDTYQKPS